MHLDSHPAGSVGWVDLAATDVMGAKEFYSGLFGWTWEDIPAPEGSPASPEGIMYSLGSLDGRLVCGLAYMAPERAEMVGLDSVWSSYFMVDSADATHQAALTAGATAMQPPMDVMDSGRIAFYADNQGAAFGIWEPREHKGSQVIGEPNVHCWTELIAADTDMALAFYGAVFGYSHMDAPPSDGPPYKMLMQGERMIAGMMNPPMPGIPNYWGVYFGAADINQAAERVAELGGEVVMGPMDTLGGPILVCRDAQGGYFDMVQMREWLS